MTDLNEPKRKEIGSQLLNAALEEFGTTTNFADAGYITPQGSLIDLGYTAQTKEDFDPSDSVADHAVVGRTFS